MKFFDKNTSFKVFIILLVTAVLLQFSTMLFAQQTGLVTAIENSMIRTNWGANDGIVPGVLLDVYQVIPVEHPVTKERFGTREKLIGTIEVVQSQDNSSLSKVLNSTEGIAVGNVIRVSFNTPETVGQPAQQVEKGVITSVQGKLVRFSMGSNDGVESNLLFDIFRNIGASTHPVTGAPIRAGQRYIGRLVVTQVSADASAGQLIAQEREIQVGDKVLLSRQQAGDLDLAQQATPPVQTDPVSQPVTQPRPQTVSPGQEQVSGPSNIVATITRVADKDVFFIWRGDYNFNAGRVFGVYRKETLFHPDTDEIIGEPLILIGKARLVESIGDLGRAVMLSSDADFLAQDMIGLTEGETVQSNQIITPENAQEVFQSQSSDILRQARELTDDVKTIQAEMGVVRNALAKLDRIDRELASQRELTRSLAESVNDIKSILLGEGISLSGTGLDPSIASVERSESPGTGINVLRVKYSDDIDVKFEMVDKNLVVSLDIDSAGQARLMPMQTQSRPQTQPQDTASTVQDTSRSASDTSGTGILESGDEGGTPFYKSFLWMSLIILLLGGAAAALYFLVLKKSPGSSSSDVDDDDDSDDEDEGGESEDDEASPEDFLAEEEEEEEITSFIDDDE